METQMRMTVVLSTNVLLLLIICGYSLRSVASSNAFHKLADSRHYHYGSIFSSLFKALSEHGASRWSPDLKKTMKPDYKYMKYMTELYKKSSRVERSLDGSNLYNTVRLIRPRDECLHQSKEFYMQDLSYNLDGVRDKEQLLRSVLLYWYDDEGRAPSRTSTCYLNIKEQGYSNQCPLCPGSHHTVNFTMHSYRGTRKRWLEIDVTPCFEPLLKFQKSKLHVLINLTCTGDDCARGEGNKGPVNVVSLRSPPLLLYLNDTSKVAHQRLVVPSRAGPRPPTADDSFDRHMRSTRDLRLSRRRRRDLPRGKRGGQSLDLHLPELRSSSEFPTSDCALYDFKVKFSQLKLDHWIVFPPKYNPRFCRGACPRTMGFIYGSPVHTMVQNIIYEKLDSSVPRPSCIPSHYSPLSVMMFEEDGSYVYKEFEDMVATSCTCR